MTAFAAIISQKPLGIPETTLFDELVAKLKAQIDGFVCDRFSSGNIAAAKLWLSHSRTQGFGRDTLTGSWLACVGNPMDKSNPSVKPAEFAGSVLNGYLSKGLLAVESLNPPFAVMLYDGRSRTIQLITDRVGLQHIYWAQWRGCHIFSTSSLALASVIGVHPDRESLIDYFFAGHLMGERTLFRELRKVGCAADISIRDGIVDYKRYWSGPREQPNEFTSEETVRILAEKLTESVALRLSGNNRTSIELTGGLDSRVNLACASKCGKSFHAMTIGQNDSAEVEVAGRLRQVGQFQHHIISPLRDIEGRFLGDLKLIHTLTDGETNALNLIASPSCNRQMGDFRDASVSGLGGEIFRGFYYISHKGFPNRTRRVRTGRLILLKMLPNIGARCELFSGKLAADYLEVLNRHVDGYFLETQGNSLYWRLDDFYFRAREQHFAGRSCSFNNYFYRCELPFFDNNVVDLSFQMPWKLKKNSRAMKEMLAMVHRGYADIQLVDGLPARPLGLRDLPVLMFFYTRFLKKVLKKAQVMVFGKAGKVRDDAGISSAVLRKLQSREVSELLDPERMASGFIYESQKFREFIASNRQNGFRDRAQIGLMLSFELTCRYLGDSLKRD